MLSNEVDGEGIELRVGGPFLDHARLMLAEEVPHVDEDTDQVVERREGASLHRKASVAIGSEPTLYLHSDLAGIHSRVGVDADEVVALVVGRRLVGEDVPPHEMAHDEILRSKGDHGEAEELALGCVLPRAGGRHRRFTARVLRIRAGKRISQSPTCV